MRVRFPPRPLEEGKQMEWYGSPTGESPTTPKEQFAHEMDIIANMFCLTMPELIAAVGQYAIEKELEVDNSFLCLDCKRHTGHIGHYYMVYDTTWEKACPEGDGMLCFDCLSERLGRDVRVSDLIDAPVNYMDRKDPKWQHLKLDIAVPNA
jgi:hypothetical protein